MSAQPRSLLTAATKTAAAHTARSAGAAVIATLGWPVVGTLLLAASAICLILLVGLAMAFSQASAERATFVYQCQSRLGAAVGTAASVQVISPPAPTGSVSASPPTYALRYLQPGTVSPAAPPASHQPEEPRPNPYATLTPDPDTDAAVLACVQAVKTGEFVGAPIRTPGTATGLRAAELAARQIGLLATEGKGSAAGPADNAISPANLVRYVYHRASQGSILMPDSLAAQIGVGDRVDPAAISPGDLVFSAFTPADGPTEVTIALSSDTGIGVSPSAGTIAVVPLPTTGNIIVKRPRTEDR